MKFVLEAYLWVGLLFGLLAFIFGMLRERSKDQAIWMAGLKWTLGAGAAALAWPIAVYWVLEGELFKRKLKRMPHHKACDTAIEQRVEQPIQARDEQRQKQRQEP